jgi:hypothetical protein
VNRLAEQPFVPAPEQAGVPHAPRAASQGQPNGAARAQTGGPLFAQLVWAHYQWERDRARKKGAAPDRVLEDRYRDQLAEFEDSEGKLEFVYWSTRSASAVAMSVKPRPRHPGRRLWRRGDSAQEFAESRGAGAPPRRAPAPLRLSEHDEEVRIHRVSDWVTRDAPLIADLLLECDLLAIRVGEVLRGTSERIAMRGLVGIEAHLLGYFERRRSKTVDRAAERDVVKRQREQLVKLESYYHGAASKAGRIVYVSGMVSGIVIALLLGGLVGFLLWAAELRGDELLLPLLCYGAGALGALVSAISRMGSPVRGDFNIDFELGGPLRRRRGVYRPFVGAVIGVGLYFLLASGILELTIEEAKEPYYYGFAAFLSGFSERFATVVFGAAEKRLAPAADGEKTQP